jgi:hypothetical protein
MGVTVDLEGIDELTQALQNMADHLTNEALEIVATAAADTMTELKSVYPDGPMRAAVHVEDRSVQYQARFVVVSPTDEAEWWEFGTQNRHTQKGWNRGAEPAHRDRGLLPIAVRHRKAMRAALVAMVQREGFDVSDDGG